MPDNFYSFLKEEWEDGSIAYQFDTDKGLLYTVYFNIYEYQQLLEDFPLLLQKGYALGFYSKKFNAQQKKQFDPLIFLTIHKIIKDFLEENGAETVLLYHCDSSNQMQAGRNTLFNKWAKKSDFLEKVCKYNLEVEVPLEPDNHKMYYMGFITLADNPFLQQIKREFEEFAINLIAPKQIE